MGKVEQKPCMFCGQMASTSLEENFTYHFVECPVCGRYNQQIFERAFGTSFKDEIAAYLYYTDRAGKAPFENKNYIFLGAKSTYDKEKVKYPFAHYASEDEIKAFYPRRFTDKIDRILLGIAEKSQYISDIVEYTREQVLSAFFVKRFDEQGNVLSKDRINNQFCKIADYLTNNQFIDASKSESGMYRVILEPDGWKRVDELQKQQAQISNTVFVAMSFADEMKEIRETIKKAITANGFEPRIMDEIEHNHQIVPEMLYEIRQSKFVIAELTGHNNGAYFEAGYALG